MAASAKAAVFSLNIRVFSACEPRPRAMLVSLMAMTPCASSASITASVENFHQGANIGPPASKRHSGVDNPATQRSFHGSGRVVRFYQERRPLASSGGGSDDQAAHLHQLGL